MCGIFGVYTKDHSPNKFISIFESLVDLNLSRGNESLSITLIYKNKEIPQVHHFSSGLNFSVDNIVFKDLEYVLGHTRSSTSRHLPNGVQIDHPFVYDDKWMAHNGILSNQTVTKLECLYNRKYQTDSWYLIRYIINYGVHCTHRLDGTFACWLWNPAVHSLFLFTNSNIIYINEGGYFTSSKYQVDDILLKPGLLYNFTLLKIEDEFIVNNPYLIL